MGVSFVTRRFWRADARDLPFFTLCGFSERLPLAPNFPHDIPARFPPTLWHRNRTLCPLGNSFSAFGRRAAAAATLASFFFGGQASPGFCSLRPTRVFDGP